MKKKHKVLLFLVGLFGFVLLASCNRQTECYTKADISYRDGVPIETVTEATEEMAKFPELVKEFFADGGSVYITNMDIPEEYGLEGRYNFVAGSYFPRSKKIVMHEDGVTRIAHEFGHYVYRKHSLESDAELDRVFEAEVDKLVDLARSDYFGTEPEFFAESFYYYIEEKETLKKELPETYEYINRVVEVYNS